MRSLYGIWIFFTIKRILFSSQKYAPVVKWISQRSSEPLLGVRIPPGAQNKSFFCGFRMKFAIPKEVLSITETLQNNGFEAYVVGGSVRDLIMGRQPKDWDVTTNASPDAIQNIFPRTVYENTFGTVGVVTDTDDEQLNNKPDSLRIVEVTPYRREGKYVDSRHPESITFVSSLEEDLARRDFTINAIAYNPKDNSIKDPFDGKKDIKDKVIRTVGDPDTRFSEDALRLMRAVRFSSQLNFSLELETQKAISGLHMKLKNVSVERIRDEFIKILLSDNPMFGLFMCNALGLLQHFLPELEMGVHVKQNQAHSFDVWGHNLRTCQHAADKKWSLDLRLAGLFHDIAKPHTRRWSKEKNDYTFHGHEVVGGKVTREIMSRMKFSREMIDKVSTLVRWHMFFSDTEQVTLSAVRRLVSNVGEKNIWDLMNLRICDRIGTGRPKENPYRFRKYKAMVEQALRDPISVKMLKINGEQIMEVTHETPGPKIGYVLHVLLEDVLEDPKKNNFDYLAEKAKDLILLDIAELKIRADKGKQKKEDLEEFEVKKLHMKHNVSK
jgi:tRNA nucleotidyltransferase (CCA-adding enzyme)